MTDKQFDLESPTGQQLVAVFSPESNGFVVAKADEILPQTSLDGGPLPLEYSHGN